MRYPLPAVLCLCITLLGLPVAALGWDATAHRLGAYATWDALGPASRDALLELLREHPRFEEDFQAEMPEPVTEMGRAARYRWLFGQAAFWPDHVRGLSEELQDRYNRPDWHWIEGRWIRGEARFQGNVYVQAEPLPDIEGRSVDAIEGEDDVDNVVLALEYALQRLRDSSIEPAQRAVALCWTLHLVADLHQPLHTGALVSAERFPDGDRGGNLIETPDGSLHARWDTVPGIQSFGRTLEELVQWRQDVRDTRAMDFNPEHWLQESRLLLQQAVYTPAIRSTVRSHEQDDAELPAIEFGARYKRDMRRITRQRVALSSARTASLLEDMGNR